MERERSVTPPRFSAVATEYARDVVDGRVPAGKWARLACKRHLDDLVRATVGHFPYVYDQELTDARGKTYFPAQRICAFAELMPHIKGRWASKGQRIKLERWQVFILASVFGWAHRETGFRRFRAADLFVPRKNAKALALDTPIPTPSGFKRMGDLHVGDEVFGMDGRPVRVIAESPVMLGQKCFDVEFSTGDRITADAGHLWLTKARVDAPGVVHRGSRRRGPGLVRVRTTQELADTTHYGSRLDSNHSVQVAAPLSLPDVEFAIDPYVLGVWIGDGHSASGRFTNADEEVVAAVEAAEGEIRCFAQRGAAACYAIGKSYRAGHPAASTFQGRLRSLNLLNNKHIPEQYLRGSLEQRLALLQGLMDTDGTASKAGQLSYCSTSKRVADDVAELVASLGLKPSIRSGEAKLYGRVISKVYRVQFWTGDVSVFRVRRKATRQRVTSPNARSRTRQIVSVREVPSVPVKCIAVDSSDKMFLVGRSFIPTHNSTIASVIGNYMLAVDGEFGAEVYSGATSEKQALEVFRPSSLMARATPEFCSRYGVVVNASNISVTGTNSKYEPVIGKPGDGASPSCAIVDEYHEHKTPELYETMQTGMGSRSQPLMLAITTAGTDLSGPCFMHQKELEKILDGVVENDQRFGIIFALDDEDDWTSEEALIKANPNYGVSIDSEFLKLQQRDAIADPRKQNTFKTKHLNVWVGASSPWINLHNLQQCGDSRIMLESFSGERCVVGLDLASKVDIASKVYLFSREIDGNRHYYAMSRNYAPAAVIAKPENAHYQAWVNGGHLIETPGNMIDLAMIEEGIIEDAETVVIGEVAKDPWGGQQLGATLAAEGFQVVDIPQQVRYMSDPMKEIAALIDSGRFHHDGNPAFVWMMSNVEVKEDRNGNLFPRKLRAENKIDAAVALIVAMSRSMVPVESDIKPEIIVI